MSGQSKNSLAFHPSFHKEYSELRQKYYSCFDDIYRWVIQPGKQLQSLSKALEA